jgi:hypothetical protein
MAAAAAAAAACRPTNRSHIKQQSQHKNYEDITPWPLVRKRTIPTDRPPLVDEI